MFDRLSLTHRESQRVLRFIQSDPELAELLADFDHDGDDLAATVSAFVERARRENPDEDQFPKLRALLVAARNARLNIPDGYEIPEPAAFDPLAASYANLPALGSELVAEAHALPLAAGRPSTSVTFIEGTPSTATSPEMQTDANYDPTRPR